MCVRKKKNKKSNLEEETAIKRTYDRYYLGSKQEVCPLLQNYKCIVENEECFQHSFVRMQNVNKTFVKISVFSIYICTTSKYEKSVKIKKI